MLWDRCGIFEYCANVGDVSVKIHSHLQGLHFVPYPHKAKMRYRVDVWFDRDISPDCEEGILKAMREGTPFLPESIRFAYSYLGVENKMDRHINRYAVFNDAIYVHYAYPTDNFWAVFDRGGAEIYLWGAEVALERLLISFLTVTGGVMPYHAACVSADSKGSMIIGDSDSGKTSITLALLERGAGYVADDILFVDTELYGHRCCDYLAVRQEFLPLSLQRHVSITKGGKSFINVNTLQCKNMICAVNSAPIGKLFLLAPLRQNNISCEKLFCAFKHDCIFVAEMLGRSIESIAGIIDESMNGWNDLLRKVPIEEVAVDYYNFNASINELCDVILS